MKCELPDCANRFDGQNKKEYGVIKFHVNEFDIVTDKKDDQVLLVARKDHIDIYPATASKKSYL
jgi:hypothetical protein